LALGSIVVAFTGSTAGSYAMKQVGGRLGLAFWLFMFNGIGGLVASDGNGGNGGSGQGTGEQRQWEMAMETVEFPIKRCHWHKTNFLNLDLAGGAA
jgi:hypothetical protein